MALATIPRIAMRSLSHTSVCLRTNAPRVATRCLHQKTSPITFSAFQRRPRGVQRGIQGTIFTGVAVARRTMFIQTEPTPNADALKFNPNQRVLPESIASPFLEYLNPRSTLAPPHPSPLAAQLLNIDGVTSVFLGLDYITVTKDSATPWAHVKPEVFAIINEFMTSGQPLVNTVAAKAGEQGQGGQEVDSLAYDENDDEVIGMIKELLETRVRPAIQEDGGDIEFRGFNDGQVMLKLRGACRTCDSSTVTLKNGIESMLMHYIEEVKGVQQVLDQEEEVALKEFAKFEDKLKQQKGSDAAPSTVGKGSLDFAQG
ncbi:HIRA-interacting protein 5 [Phaeosphaeriaceae sp. PMI808]|nr:HIRA-interacting protein 5 [Phaeosphaeriaceae sp. PMI808]